MRKRTFRKSLAERNSLALAKRYIAFVCLFLAMAIPAIAQTQSYAVTGKVTDNTGQAVIGATVSEAKSTARPVMTDVDGKYSITVSGPNAVLSFASMGYVTLEYALNGRTTVDVELQDDAKQLEEVVVVGFGAQKKANLTGAVSSVKMDEVLGDRPIINVSAALQGAVPGLLVSGNHQVGQGKSFQIRGAYSVGVKNADGTYGAVISPLVLIDNVEGSMSMLNPDDIESISVLKDGASAAIYGARAAGGVIIVTTKLPKKGTKFSLNYNNNLSSEKAINLPEQASLFDYFRMYKETGSSNSYWAAGQNIDTWVQLLKDYKANPSSFDIVGDGMYKNPDDSKVYYLRERDSYKQMVENSFMQTHNISASGSSDKIRFRISAGYTSQDGVIVYDKDQYKRMNIGAFVSADMTSWFTQEIDIKYASSRRTVPVNQNQTGVFPNNMLSFTPEGIIPGSLYGLSGDYPIESPISDLVYAGLPVTNIANPRIFTKSIIKPFNGFEAVFEYTFDKRDTRYDFYTGQYTVTSIQQSTKLAPGTDAYTKQHYFTDYNAINAYATYTKSLKNHNFKIMAGFNQESSYYEILEARVLSQAVLSVPSMNRALGEKYPYDDYSEVALRGVFFRVNYDYMDKYLIEVNGRYDGSSKFPKNQRFGFFPSASVGWNIANESFLEKADWLNQLKLRASWANVGNQNINPYTFLPTMNSGIWLASNTNWLNNGAQVNVTDPPALVRNNFTWETVEKINIGLDFAFLKSRLSGSFEVYQNDTKGMLAPGMKLPAVVGATAPYQNTADMRTKGWEIAVNWRDRIGQVGYRIGANLTDYQSEITKYDANPNNILGSYYKGLVMGEIWGYENDGFYTIDDFESTTTWKLKEGVTAIQGITNTLRPGDYKWKNLSDAGDQTPANTITTGANTADNPGDRKIIGNTTPRFQFGANLGVDYKGFDLSVMLQGVGKRDYWLGNPAYFPFNAGDMFTFVYYNQLDYWTPKDAANGDYTPTNPNAKLPRIYNTTTASAWGSNMRVSDKLLSSAAYMRIKNVTLAYTFGQSILKKIHISGLKLFVSIENLATFSSLPKGYDPETLSWTFPAYRTTSFGLSVTL